MIYIRIILSLLFLYGAYTETGIWTVLILFLILVNTEVEIYLKS